MFSFVTELHNVEVTNINYLCDIIFIGQRYKII